MHAEQERAEVAGDYDDHEFDRRDEASSGEPFHPKAAIQPSEAHTCGKQQQGRQCVDKELVDRRAARHGEHSLEAPSLVTQLISAELRELPADPAEKVDQLREIRALEAFNLAQEKRQPDGKEVVDLAEQALQQSDYQSHGPRREPRQQ